LPHAVLTTRNSQGAVNFLPSLAALAMLVSTSSFVATFVGAIFINFQCEKVVVADFHQFASTEEVKDGAIEDSVRVFGFFEDTFTE
jgi:hypothetical protein